MTPEIKCLTNDITMIDSDIDDHLKHIEIHRASIDRLRQARDMKQQDIALLESAKANQIQV